MYCIKCRKEIEESESKKYNSYCKECYKNTDNYKKKKNQRQSTIIILGILTVIIIALILKNFTNDTKNYKVNVEKVAIVTLNDDDIFYKKLKEKYKGYKLIFVSATLKNNTQENYTNLSYKLSSSNSNTYTRATSYITEDEEFIENYYKINDKIFDDSTNDLLGGKEKRIIVGFMIPEAEIINDTNFNLIISNFEINYGDAETLRFNTSEIIKSNTMKELYKDEEKERAEQTISLAYSTSINDWLGWMTKFETTYNYKYNDLFNVAFSAINAFAETTNYNYGWNGRSVKTEDGSKLDYEKAKNQYPDISKEIEGMEKTVQEIGTLYKNYNKKINNLNVKKLRQMDSDVISYICEINKYFGLKYNH